MLDQQWVKALVEAARLRLWTDGRASLACPRTLLADSGLRGPASEAERLMLLGIVEDLRQKTSEPFLAPGGKLGIVVAHIRAHSRDSRLCRARVARALKLSDSWVGHHFKSELGIPFSRFLVELRLSDAAKLLRTTGGSVKEVALTVGFRSHGSFTRAFSAKFGVTPSNWRYAEPSSRRQGGDTD